MTSIDKIKEVLIPEKALIGEYSSLDIINENTGENTVGENVVTDATNETVVNSSLEKSLNSDPWMDNKNN